MIAAIDRAPTAQLTFPLIVEAELARAHAAAKADPGRERETLVFDDGVEPAIRYAAPQTPVRGGLVRFGHTVRPNAAGYFLIFRETTRRPKRRPERVVRDQFDSTIRKGEAAATSRRLALAYFTASQARRR